MSLRGLQHYREIDWTNPITKGLRHVIVPNVLGLGDDGGLVVKERLSRNGSWYLRCYSGITANNLPPQQKPDMNIFAHAYVGSHSWRLGGPQMWFDCNRDFSVLCRFHVIGVFDGHTRPGWGIGGGGYSGWEMVVPAYNPTTIFGQFGQWTVEGINSYMVTDPTADLGTRYSVGIFVWDAAVRRYFASHNSVWGGYQNFTGVLPWMTLGGGLYESPYWEWGIRGQDAQSEVSQVTHVYMWERALQPSEAIRLAKDIGIIFGATSVTPSFQLAGGVPPEPPAGDGQADNQHHAIG